MVEKKKSMPTHTLLTRHTFLDGDLVWIKCDFDLSSEQAMLPPDKGVEGFMESQEID